MIVPVSTYRLQLNASFSFKQGAELLPYLHQLGITTIYASPFFAAPPGSAHGYDVCDSHILNTEIGTLEQLEQIMVQSFDAVLALSKQHKVDMRTAAYMLSISRVATVHRLRGIYA